LLADLRFELLNKKLDYIIAFLYQTSTDSAEAQGYLRNYAGELQRLAEELEQEEQAVASAGGEKELAELRARLDKENAQ
jgi:hypothetical protein